jgi:hypothetical protein
LAESGVPSITLLLDWCGHGVDCDQLKGQGDKTLLKGDDRSAAQKATDSIVGRGPRGKATKPGDLRLRKYVRKGDARSAAQKRAMVIAHRASCLKLTDPLSRRGKARARRKLLGKNYKPKKLKPGDKRLLKGDARSAAQKAVTKAPDGRVQFPVSKRACPVSSIYIHLLIVCPAAAWGGPGCWL